MSSLISFWTYTYAAHQPTIMVTGILKTRLQQQNIMYSKQHFLFHSEGYLWGFLRINNTGANNLGTKKVLLFWNFLFVYQSWAPQCIIYSNYDFGTVEWVLTRVLWWQHVKIFTKVLIFPTFSESVNVSWFALTTRVVVAVETGRVCVFVS